VSVGRRPGGRDAGRESLDPRGRPPATEPSLRAWVVTKLIAMLLLFGASGLLYHVAASDGFRIERVVVVGAQLIPAAEIERTAAVTGLNIFWVREEEVGRRLQAIAAVQSARARTVLPDRLEVRIVERAPVAVWQNGGMSYLVDSEGRVLQATEQSVALPTIHDVGPPTLQAGSRVDRGALTTMFQLQQLLPRIAGLTPRELEYGPDTGVTVVTDAGPRIRFGGDDDLEWKVSALVAVRRELDREGKHPELIDLRFKDRPYVR
jgi:cell division septal protein FtsQ